MFECGCKEERKNWKWNLFIWSLARSSSARVYCWRVLLWVTEVNDKFITFTKTTILLQLRCKKARRLMIITPRNAQHSNSAKLDENHSKKTRAWCGTIVAMLFKDFYYEVSWIESLKIEAVKFVVYFESAHLTSCRALTQALLKYLVID